MRMLSVNTVPLDAGEQGQRRVAGACRDIESHAKAAKGQGAHAKADPQGPGAQGPGPEAAAACPAAPGAGVARHSSQGPREGQGDAIHGAGHGSKHQQQAGVVI